MEKALLYYDNQDLPPSWDHDELLGTDDDEDFNDEEVWYILAYTCMLWSIASVICFYYWIDNDILHTCMNCYHCSK